jgi:hypothetical protein
MTYGADLRVLPLERGGVEARAMGVEAPAAGGRVASEAVSLRMTGDAALQILAGSLPVVQEESLLGVMKAGATEAAGRNQPRGDMAVRAELGLIVALAAGALPAVRGNRVRRQETTGVITRWSVGRARTVTLETGGPSMARGAALRSRRGRCCMVLGKVQSMGLGSSPLGLCPPPASRCGGGDGLYRGRRASVAGEATLLGVTRGATGRALADLLAVLAQECRIGMTRGGLECRPDRQRPWIRGKRLDGADLRRVHMTLGAEILGMARGTGSCDRLHGAGQLPVLPGRKSGLAVRGRRWKVAYRCTGELNGFRQREVTGGAGRVRRLEVRGLDSVAGKAVGDYRAPHLHPIGPRGRVAGAAGKHGISRSFGNELRMLLVGEPQIART